MKTLARRPLDAGLSTSGGAVLTIIAAAAVITVAALWQSTIAEAASAPMTRTSQSFIDSLGVAAHLSAKDYPEAETLWHKMQYLGISHVRTNSAVTDKPTGKGAQTAALLGKNGVKLHFTTPKPKSKQPTESDVKKAIDSRLDYIVRNDLGRYTESIETFNEYDNAGVKNWPTVLAQANRYLYDKRGRIGDHVKVLGPALIGYSLRDTTTRYRSVAGDRLSESLDYGNIHSYYSGNTPESAREDAASDSGRQFNIKPDGKPATDLDARLNYYAWNISKDKPMIVTEMGYHNADGKKGGVPETVAGTYVPRAYLENFRIGVARSYVYELMNEKSVKDDKEQQFGLFKSDGSAKPAATAIHNMTKLLSGGDVTSVKPLAVSFGGNTAGLHSVVLQKHENEYWLALWRDQSVYDIKSGKVLTPSPASVSVALPSARAITTYSNLAAANTAEKSLGTQRTFNVAAGANVVLVRITQ